MYDPYIIFFANNVHSISEVKIVPLMEDHSLEKEQVYLHTLEKQIDQYNQDISNYTVAI